MGTHVSGTRTICTGSPQGCVPSPFLLSLYTNSCTSSNQSIRLLKFAVVLSANFRGLKDWWLDTTNLWWGRGQLQTGDWSSGVLVQPEQPGAQRTEDSGTGCGLKKGPCLPFHGLHHHPGAEVGGEHQLHNVQSPAEDVFPEAAKGIQHASDYNGAVLYCQRWVHPHLLQPLLVRCSHCQGQVRTSEDHALSW